MSQSPFYTDDPAVQAALFDIDGTLTAGGDVWSGLINSPKVKRSQKMRLYTVALPQYALSKVGLVNQAKFRERWVQLMAALVRGWSTEDVDALCTQIVNQTLIPALRLDMMDILKRHQAHRHPVILVSTMFDGIVSRLAAYLEIDAGFGSQVEIRDGQATGRISGPLCAGSRKLDFASRYFREHCPHISLLECAAYADSQSDIPFLAGVGYPVAVYPDPPMRSAAQHNHWRIFED